MASSLGGTLVVVYQKEDTPRDQMHKEAFASSANEDRDVASIFSNPRMLSSSIPLPLVSSTSLSSAMANVLNKRLW